MITILLDTLPIEIMALLLVLPAMVIAGILPFVIKRIFFRDYKGESQEITSAKFSMIGGLYAALLAFIVVLGWQDLQDAENACHQEADSAVNLFRLAGGFSDSVRVPLRGKLREYVTVIIEKEWKTIAYGEQHPEANLLYNSIYNQYVHLQPSGEQQSALYSQSLDMLGRFSDGRIKRLLASRADMPILLWVVLVVGGIVTVSFTSFFHSHNMRIQAAMNAVLAGMIVLILLLVTVLDHPFTGNMRLQPDEFHEALKVMDEFIHIEQQSGK